MPRSGGTYSLPANTLAVSGNTISSTYYNNFVNDVATEITASVPRDGSAAMTARLTSTGLNKGAYANLASASTTDLSSTSTGNITITGTTTITSFGSGTAGIECDLVFSGALTLTHNATSLILPGGANITTAAGDSCRAISLGSGNWRVVNYEKAMGPAWVRLASGTASAAATLDLALTTGYSQYKLFARNYYPATSSANLVARFSVDGGSTYPSGAGAYSYAGRYANSAAISSDIASNNSYIFLAGQLTNSALCNNSEITIFPGNASYQPTLLTSGVFYLSPNIYWVTVGGRYGGVGPASHIRLLMTSGNIASMEYTLYGIV